MPDIEKGCKWFFAEEPIKGAEPKGPNRSMMLTFKQSPYVSLVRESIQNSLDAAIKDSDQPVKVVYSNGYLHKRDYPELFKIEDRIAGVKQYFPDNEQTHKIIDKILERIRSYNGRMPFVKISDFNTTGMSYENGSTNTPFYAFLHAEGLHVNDNNNSGGSFGAGKDAYFAMSDISSVMCYTLTNDGNHYFQCASRLCSHKVDGTRYTSKGYYDNNDTEPINDINNMPTCHFFRKDEAGSGSDIFILGMHLDDENARKEIIRAVLQNFWMAVYDGKLEVKVNGNDHIPNVDINKSNLKSLMRKTFDNKIDKSTDNNPERYNPRPYFEAYSTITENSSDYDKEKYSYYESDETQYPTLGTMKLYLLKDTNATDKITFMRSPKMKVYAERVKNYRCGIYGLFLCTNPKGDEILRDLEDQAHKGWRSANARIFGRDVAKTAIAELNNFVDSCLQKEFKTDDDQETDVQSLANFLNIAEDLLDNKKHNSYIGEKGDGTTDAGNTRLSTPHNGEFVEVNQPSDEELTKLKFTTHTHATSNPDGELGGNGHNDGTQKSHTRHPGNDPATHDPDGTEGNYNKSISIEYSQLTKKINDEIFNTLLINSSEEVANIKIQLTVIGENGNYNVGISKVLNHPDIILDGNILSNIHLQRGLNTFNVKFNDNMIHSIKISIPA